MKRCCVSCVVNFHSPLFLSFLSFSSFLPQKRMRAKRQGMPMTLAKRKNHPHGSSAACVASRYRFGSGSPGQYTAQ